MTLYHIFAATHQTFNPINILRHDCTCVESHGEFFKTALRFSIAQILYGVSKRIHISSLVVSAHIKPINDGTCLTTKALNNH